MNYNLSKSRKRTDNKNINQNYTHSPFGQLDTYFFDNFLDFLTNLRFMKRKIQDWKNSDLRTASLYVESFTIVNTVLLILIHCWINKWMGFWNRNIVTLYKRRTLSSASNVFGESINHIESWGSRGGWALFYEKVSTKGRLREGQKYPNICPRGLWMTPLGKLALFL